MKSITYGGFNGPVSFPLVINEINARLRVPKSGIVIFLKDLGIHKSKGLQHHHSFTMDLSNHRIGSSSF